MRRIVFPVVLLVVALWPAAALAQPKSPASPAEQVVLSGDVLVRKGHVVGQVVVFTGSVTVLGVVDGDVVVLDGPIAIQGQVSGDVVAVSGTVDLAPTAQVGGSVTAADEVSRAEGAQVGGSVRSGVRLTLGGPLGALGSLLPSVAVAASVLVAGLLLLLVVPRGGDRIAEALAGAPVSSTAWGAVVVVLVPVLGLLATASVLGLPLGLALLLGAGLLWLIGQAGISWGIGRLIVREPRSRLGALLAGWAVGAVLGLVPFLNIAWWGLGSMVGLGAVLVAAWRTRRGGGELPPARERGGRHAAGRVVVPTLAELPAPATAPGDES